MESELQKNIQRLGKVNENPAAWERIKPFLLENILTDNTESVKNEEDIFKNVWRNKLIEHIGCWVE